MELFVSLNCIISVKPEDTRNYREIALEHIQEGFNNNLFTEQDIEIYSEIDSEPEDSL